MRVEKFREVVWTHAKERGRRSLPWRKTRDPYKILVSEIMLQQTQVARVIPYYTAWLKKFPTADTLARASLGDVLRQWQGLGYNRRAKMLHEAAKAVVKECGGKMPHTSSELEALPGIGHYTAGAVMAFAYNQDVVMIETNIRTVITYHFFAKKEQVSDKEILTVLEKVLVTGRSREWYAALMDYGAHLKATGVQINKKSKTYTAQSKFEGSGRQVRGALLRALAASPHTKAKLLTLFPKDRAGQVTTQLAALVSEKFILKTASLYTLP
jgi:A/G-specific adenine glycosylase